MRWFLFSWLFISSVTQAAIRFELIPLQIKQQQIQVQLADTLEKRMRGLMQQQPVLHGMLLVYESPREMVLWMKDTPESLDVAFIDTHWRISKISHMQANSEELHSSEQDVIAALEMPSGWFLQQNIQVGDAISNCQRFKQSCQPAN